VRSAKASKTGITDLRGRQTHQKSKYSDHRVMTVCVCEHLPYLG